MSQHLCRHTRGKQLRVGHQVGMLEVCASYASVDDTLMNEQLWKDNLQSREMGLNRN